MRLLVAYLATPGGADAVALGARLARTFSASIDICLVLPREGASATVVNHEDILVEHAREWVAEAASRVPEDIDVTTHVMVDESSSGGLIREATRLDSALIIVGGSGGGMVSNSLGSVVNELLLASPVPVVLTPRGTRNAKVGYVHQITCSAGGPADPAVLTAAIDLSARAKRPLRLAVPLNGDAVDKDPEAAAQATKEAMDALTDAAGKRADDLEVTAATATGRTVESAAASMDWSVGDLIVVGIDRVAQSRLLFLGSAAGRLLRVLSVPIVVVPHGPPAHTHTR